MRNLGCAPIDSPRRRGRSSVAILAALCALAAGPACREEPAPSKPPVAAEPAPAAGVARKQLRGSWVISLNDAQKRELDVMAMAFRDPPPTAEELTKKAFSNAEQGVILALADLRQRKPDDPQLAEARKVVQGMAESSLWIGTSSLAMAVGGLRESAVFEVLTETSSVVTVKARVRSGREETLVFTVIDAGTIEMGKQGQADTLRFERRP